MARKEVDFNTIIGMVLRYGVIASFTVIGVGSVLLFAEGQTGYYLLGSAEQLIERHNRFLIGLVPLIQGVFSAKPYAVIDLGLLILLATPIARVFISIFLFVKEKRYIFVMITITVLALLLFSMFVLGPLMSG
ncbi:MAG TPA: DUF1634 domain-containing protein [Nitrososphaerales archaeon]|nr:DUF1634 domain-containing protein [Nitrososphaerales archaeon]